MILLYSLLDRSPPNNYLSCFGVVYQTSIVKFLNENDVVHPFNRASRLKIGNACDWLEEENPGWQGVEIGLSGDFYGFRPKRTEIKLLCVAVLKGRYLNQSVNPFIIYEMFNSDKKKVIRSLILRRVITTIRTNIVILSEKM